MNLANVWVQSTQYDDGSADFTITIGNDDHKFSASTKDDNTAVVSYQETNSWLGGIQVSEPSEAVFKAVIQSDKMTEYLEQHDLDTVVRKRNHD